MSRHYETHLYTYAVALTLRGMWTAPNLQKLRAKVIKSGHTEGECLCVERDPWSYVKTGSFTSQPGRFPSSWVIVSRKTGKAVCEVFSAYAVSCLRREKYDAIPIGDYLAGLNEVRA